MCNCIEDANKLLAPMGHKLSLMIFFDGRPSMPLITTEPVGKGKGVVMTLTPTFCPFCGEKYIKETT